MSTQPPRSSRKHGLPLVAIVGRPNVGKSTLFNRLAGRRKAIILDKPGLTRDRIFARADWRGRDFFVIDTGGYEPDAEGELRLAIREQTTMAIQEADVIVFMVDGRQGIIGADHEIVDLLRRTRKPVILAVNKCDTPEQYNGAWLFSELGIEHLFPVCSLRGHGVGELLDSVYESLPPEPEASPETEGAEAGEEPPRIAIVGRQNVGKSTLVNAILGEKRMVASDIPGTTRDAVDSDVVVNGKPYVIIDTAGIRRRGKIEQGAEKLSVMRAVYSMKRADLAVVLINADEGMADQDAHIIGLAQEAGCAAILAVNKWDLVEKENETAGAWAKKLRDEWGFFAYAPIVFISALTGQRVRRLFEFIDQILPEYRKKIDTGELNRWLKAAMTHSSPPTRRGKALKINYIVQTDVCPPSFMLFVNDPNLLHFSYERYLINQLRLAYGFEGTPIRITTRKKN